MAAPNILTAEQTSVPERAVPTSWGRISTHAPQIWVALESKLDGFALDLGTKQLTTTAANSSAVAELMGLGIRCGEG